MTQGKDVRRILGLAMLLCLLAGAPAQAQARPQRAQPASDLSAALAMVPAGATETNFTDWALIKQYTGMTALTSKSSAAARQRFVRSIGRGQAAASAYGLSYFAVHAATWSWDSTDLVWEVSFYRSGSPPVYALKFRDDFDFTSVIAHFVQRGFTRGDYDGVPVYTHSMDPSASWLQTTELAILNTAVLAHQKMLVLSSAPQGVRAVLDTASKKAAALAQNRSLSAAVTRLGTVASAVLMPAAAACQAFDPAHALLARKPPPSTVKAALKRLFMGQTVHPYAAFGLGYRDEGGRPVGVTVLHYGDATGAMADLAPRRTLATKGMSFLANEPYRALFTLDHALVRGDDLVLRLRPSAGRPQIFFNMVMQSDMLFAACSASA